MSDDQPARVKPSDDAPVSAHYLGEAGRRYAYTVQRNRRLASLLDLEKFQAFVRTSDTVLDFGCASGELLLALGAAESIGVEPNPVTRAEAVHAGLAVFESLSAVADRSVDVVVSNHALEHVLSPYDALLDLNRVLRADGSLVLCVPADDWRNAPQWEPDDRNHHVFAWTPLTLGNLLTEAGFDPVFVRMRQRAWPPGYERLYRLPPFAWDVICRVWAVVRRRREIVAVAKARGDIAPRPQEQKMLAPTTGPGNALSPRSPRA